MAWYACCDRCGVMDVRFSKEPLLPERWLQLRNGRLYCDGDRCQKVGWRAFKKQKPSPAQRAMDAVYGPARQAAGA